MILFRFSSLNITAYIHFNWVHISVDHRRSIRHHIPMNIHWRIQWIVLEIQIQPSENTGSYAHTTHSHHREKNINSKISCGPSHLLWENDMRFTDIIWMVSIRCIYSLLTMMLANYFGIFFSFFFIIHRKKFHPLCVICVADTIRNTFNVIQQIFYLILHNLNVLHGKSHCCREINVNKIAEWHWKHVLFLNAQLKFTMQMYLKYKFCFHKRINNK